MWFGKEKKSKHFTEQNIGDPLLYRCESAVEDPCPKKCE